MLTSDAESALATLKRTPNTSALCMLGSRSGARCRVFQLATCGPAARYYRARGRGPLAPVERKSVGGNLHHSVDVNVKPSNVTKIAPLLSV